MAKHPARRAALETLLGRQKGRVDIDGSAMATLDPARRRQAHDLVMGVRRNLFLLDAVLRRYLKQPVRTVPPPTREALRCGVYDLVFNERVPAATIVSDTVELVGRSKSLRGLVNAVLRRGADESAVVDIPRAPTDRHHVGVGPRRVVRFERPVLPDPDADLVKHHATRHTLTELFVEAFVRTLPLEHQALFEACGRRMPVLMRPVRGVGMDALKQRVEEAGASVIATNGGGIEVQADGPLSKFAPLTGGMAVVQDLVAAEVAPFVDPQPGERVLDLCAPPGGKTVHLAELMEDEGEIVAAHVGPARAIRLIENVQRLGHDGIVKLHDLGEDGAKLPDGPFDRVLVDTPCSNTGVLMKRVDARFRVNEDELNRLETLQQGLLLRAADLVRPGGVLVYATCSIVAGENHLMTRRLMDARAAFRLDEERLRYPHRTGRDGGYMARLVRDGTLATS